MSKSNILGGTFRFPVLGKSVHRMGYGAMKLAGPMVWGEPADRPAAVAVVRAAIELGINHIDTSDFYGPHVVNHIIKEAAHPYPTDLVLVTKVGARRGPDKSWPKALSAAELTSAVHDNLRHLGLAALDIVNLRVGDAGGTNSDSIAEPLATLVKLKEQGLIRAIGISNVTTSQYREARSMTQLACVQNHYNLSYRKDDALIDELAKDAVAFVPYFPLGGFQPLQAATLDAVAREVDASPRQVALAWLLQRSPNILLIPGTSSVDHLRENAAAAALHLPPAAIAKLNAMASA